jgi:glyoxylase-like metal-dependent hydrolase (beta-lactamase superfamily II)
VDRREFFKGAAAGAFALCAAPRIRAQAAGGVHRLADVPVRRLTDKLAVMDGGGSNVLAFASGDGLVLVDSGAPNSGEQVMAALMSLGADGRAHTLFNTHYHLDQTGNNEMFAAAGTKIVAHERTREWMSTDYWVPAEERYEKARPKAAWPAETFQTTGSLKAGGEQIDYGYLLMAHTSGDIYVHFKNANVIAVGDVASPVRDPALDYFTGAWIGGRVDAMDLVLKLGNEQTKIVPAYGPVMTRAEFKAERDLMEEVRARLFKQVREGEGPTDMLEAGLLNGLPRTWRDPKKFLYDAAKGLWAHHDKLDPNVV